MFRETIYQDNIKDLVSLPGKIEIDETMFGGRIHGKRGWGVTGKNIVFGIYPDTAKSLLFLSHHMLKMPRSLILTNIPKQVVSTIPTTGLLMPSYLYKR